MRVFMHGGLRAAFKRSASELPCLALVGRAFIDEVRVRVVVGPFASSDIRKFKKAPQYWSQNDNRSSTSQGTNGNSSLVDDII